MQDRSSSSSSGNADASRIHTRRDVLGTFLTPALCTLGASLPGGASARGANTQVAIYSPAPPGTTMHALNSRLAGAASQAPALKTLDVVPLALPDSINNFATLPVAERGRHWPIVTSIDMDLARNGADLGRQRYPRTCPDLKFVSALTDAGFGIAIWGEPLRAPDGLRGKRIAVPPRPSTVRLLTETVLRDAWGVLDDVTLIDMMPPQIARARANGEIDGTSWNLIGPTPAGYQRMFHDPADPTHYVPIDDVALRKINAANPFTLQLKGFMSGTPAMLSLSHCLAAWDESDAAQISIVLDFLRRHGRTIPGFPVSVPSMMAWPGAIRDVVHPVARRFYATHGIEI